jgi:DNA-binding MarR family transcriptional regulator
VPHISKRQKKILEILEVKPEMTTKEIAEMIYGRLVECRTTEYSSINRSLRSLEREGMIQRVFIQLRWRRKPKTAQHSSGVTGVESVREHA